MPRFFIFLYTLFALFNMSLLTAVESKDNPSAKADLHILELLPHIFPPLAVAPGIPADFIALSPKGVLDPYDWIYWGPKDVLQAYFENPDSLKESILQVKLSANVSQIGPDAFNADHFLKQLQENSPKGSTFFKTQWGDYPVLAFTTKLQGLIICMAWAGLNDPEAG